MLKDGKILMAKAGETELHLLPQMSNRHGLIAGATGTGKTITLKVMAEGFSDMGVPVFFSDVKGDLSGMCQVGTDSEDMQKRIANFGLEGFEYKKYPVTFWDLFGEKGHPVRVTMSGLGPMLLARLLNLTDVQEGVLNIVFKVADDQGMLLLDMKDLRAMLQYVAENKEEYTMMYGNVADSSVGAIQRALLSFEQEGGVAMFGEPALDVKDWIRTDTSGRGTINILSSEKLFQSPMTYGCFLLWMLTELYENLPEVGDLEKPRMVFFFDEAHVLFDDTPKALHQKIAQVIKLIRSKGVGVFFITQSPGDIPSDVLGQLSNRVQHGLRAFTPAEQKGIKAAAQSFRVNPAFDTEDALQALGTGEALVSFLDAEGIPCVVEKAKILPPQSLMGPASIEVVNQIITAGEFDLKYRTSVDRESAYEIIMRAKDELKKAQENFGKNQDGQGQNGGGQPEGQPGQNGPQGGQPGQGQNGPQGPAGGDAQSGENALANTEGTSTEVSNGKKMTLTEQYAAKTKAKKEASVVGTVAKKAAKSAVTNATSTVTRGISTNLVNSITGSGKQTSAATLGKRAATNALSAVMRTGTSSIIRGIFGNLK